MLERAFDHTMEGVIFGLERFRQRVASARHGWRRDEFLYRTSETSESVFDTMQKYTTQKLILGSELARRISRLNGGQNIKITDIGTSKGTLLGMIVGQLLTSGYKKRIHFSLIEPDRSSVETLRGLTQSIPDVSMGKFTSDIYKEGWEEHVPTEPQDGIIFSHTLYHLNPAEFGRSFSKMVDILKPGGHLFVVARERAGNQVFDLIQRYKSMMPGELVNEITIQDALPVLEGIVNKDLSLSIKIDRSHPTVVLPFESDALAARRIMAFFLQRSSWEMLPNEVRTDILEHYGGKDSTLYQVDTIVEIAKAKASFPDGTD